MKRQTQVPGIRRWFADDFLELQSEAITALDAIVGAYNKPCVVAGCELSNGLITPGFVALSIDGEGLKMMPFDGNIAAPCYLVAKKTEVNSVYADGISRLSAYQYKAIAQSQLPSAEVSYIKVETNGKCDRLTDVMQDATHRMVTDAEKGVWDSKETPEGAQAKANKALEQAKQYTDEREAYDYVVCDTETLRNIGSSGATSVLIKKGAYSTSPGVFTLPSSCKKVVGEGGSYIRGTLISGDIGCTVSNLQCDTFEGFNYVLNCQAKVQFNSCSNLINCWGDTVITTGALFNSCTNLTNCTVYYSYQNQNQAYSFRSCNNLVNCSIVTTNIYHRGFYQCNGMVQCQSPTNTISSCTGVYRCTAPAYTSSYYSNIISTSNYACADTLNGGWNKIV